jgi:hypothetical protein
MNEQLSSAQGTTYTIKVVGHLDPAWSAWFEDLTLAHEPDGCTTFTGKLVDQAALHGLLIKIRDLGLPLISVQRLEPVRFTSIVIVFG